MKEANAAVVWYVGPIFRMAFVEKKTNLNIFRTTNTTFDSS